MLKDRTFSKLGILEDPALEGTVITARPGEVIFEPQTVAEYVYYVQRGEIRMYMVGPADESRLMTIMGPGDWLGAGALAREPVYAMRATALNTSTLVRVKIERLMEVLSGNPMALLELSRDLAGRLHCAVKVANSLLFGDCNERLINTLVRFSRSAASTQKEHEVVLRITHDQLAQAIGVARETVSLALTQLRQQNVLRTGRNELIFNPEVLRQLNRG